MSRSGSKHLVWLRGEVRTPPLSEAARLEAGVLLRRIQRGESIGLPHSRPMPTIGSGCHELRIVDEHSTWRIVYRVDTDAIVIGDVFSKKTRATPQSTLDACRRRFREYDAIMGGGE